jgi:hypothetical protein
MRKIIWVIWGVTLTIKKRIRTGEFQRARFVHCMARLSRQGCPKNGIEVVRTFIEKGESATAAKR